MRMEQLRRRLEMALYDQRRISRTVARFCQSLQDVSRTLNADDGKKKPPKKPGKPPGGNHKGHCC